MSLFKEVLEQIRENQSKKFNSISWTEKFPRLSAFIPGILRGKYYGVTGAPNAAKTQFTDNVFLCHVVDFAIEHNIEVEIVYFSFEISKHTKIANLLSKRLFDAYGVKIPPRLLMKVDSTALDEIQLSKIDKAARYFEELERRVTFIDDRLTPRQMYDYQLARVRQNGVHDHLTDRYIPNNPDKYLIFITDHISLISPDTGQTLHQALTSFSNNNVFMKNKYGATIVNIHQQGVDSQVQQFTSRGDNIASKLEPKLANLADNRTLGRDYDVLLGLFSPKAYGIKYYREYKAEKFGDKCRWLSIAKNRDGEPDHHLPLYFDGAVGYFEELPRPEEFVIQRGEEKNDNVALYEKYQKGLVGILDPNKQRSFTF